MARRGVKELRLALLPRRTPSCASARRGVLGPLGTHYIFSDRRRRKSRRGVWSGTCSPAFCQSSMCLGASATPFLAGLLPHAFYLPQRANQITSLSSPSWPCWERALRTCAGFIMPQDGENERSGDLSSPELHKRPTPIGRENGGAAFGSREEGCLGRRK